MSMVWRCLGSGSWVLVGLDLYWLLSIWEEISRDDEYTVICGIEF